MGCQLYDDYRAMLLNEGASLDLCSISTGIAWHCRMTIDALQAGCHVLVEKPAAGTVEEIDAMIATSKATGKHVFVGFQDLIQDSTRTVKQKLVEGALGQIHSIHAMGCWPRKNEYYNRNNWAGKIKIGSHWIYDSPANNAFAHFLMAPLYFASPKLDSAEHFATLEAELFRCRDIESFDTAALRLRTYSGTLIHFHVTHACTESLEPSVKIVGDKGSVLWNSRRNFTFSADGSSLPDCDVPTAIVNQYVNILRALEDDEYIGCSLEMARCHTEVINQLHRDCPNIRNVPNMFLNKNGEGVSQLISIHDIEPMILHCSAKGLLFSEYGAAWAEI